MEVKHEVPLFAMAMIQRIGHDHQASFWHVLVLVLDVTSSDANRKQAATCRIHLGHPIFLQILDPYKITINGAD